MDTFDQLCRHPISRWIKPRPREKKKSCLTDAIITSQREIQIINEIIRENIYFSYFGNQATFMGNPVHTSDAYSKTESGEVEGIKNINNTGMATI